MTGGKNLDVIRRGESGLVCKAATGTRVAASPRYVADDDVIISGPFFDRAGLVGG